MNSRLDLLLSWLELWIEATCPCFRSQVFGILTRCLVGHLAMVLLMHVKVVCWILAAFLRTAALMMGILVRRWRMHIFNIVEDRCRMVEFVRMFRLEWNARTLNHVWNVFSCHSLLLLVLLPQVHVVRRVLFQSNHLCLLLSAWALVMTDGAVHSLLQIGLVFDLVRAIAMLLVVVVSGLWLWFITVKHLKVVPFLYLTIFRHWRKHLLKFTLARSLLEVRIIQIALRLAILHDDVMAY